MDLADIATCAQLACILEVSAPKPGNVNRMHDFSDTKFEHFASSGVAIGAPVYAAARQGFMAGKGEINLEDIGVGRLIKEAVFRTSKWQNGKNTNLGISMLLIPVAASAGMSLAKGDGLCEYIDSIIRAATYQDTLDLYEAIRHANPGGLGSSGHLDVNDPHSDKKIEEKQISLHEIMKDTPNDSIARELVTSYDISFNIGYPALMKARKNSDVSSSVVSAYLTILSRVPDTLIRRKNGMEISRKVSMDARSVLKGELDIEEFDMGLRSSSNHLNPGTTADLVTTSLMISLLEGMRP
ncbi:MAG: triphosphoribosyl-dephospho-CoA synthase [Candidatus Hydrothermarchaeaceae archaeon]